MFSLKVLLALIGALAVFGVTAEARRYFDSYDDDWRPRPARDEPMSLAVRRRFIEAEENQNSTPDSSAKSSHQADDASSMGDVQKEEPKLVLVDEVGERIRESREPERQVVLVQRPEVPSYAERPPPFVSPPPQPSFILRPPPPPQPEYRYIVDRPRVRVIDDGSYKSAPPRYYYRRPYARPYYAPKEVYVPPAKEYLVPAPLPYAAPYTAPYTAPIVHTRYGK
uniref:Extensin-like n=1 Tax=Bursaphelenchus xylophilus TaxID=6326 RepID=A0A1I7S457_BURXY